jgi:hypothetical protein
MAKKKLKALLPIEQARLTRLVRQADVWQIDARQLEAEIEPDECPWLIAVADTDGLVHGFEVVAETPELPQLWAVLVKAMTDPTTGGPHRPAAVQVSSADLAAGLTPPLEAIEVACSAVDSLPVLDRVFEDLAEQMSAADEEPGLLDTPEMTPETVGDFFEAAAYFHKQAPWKKPGERTIRLECNQFPEPLWYAVMMGQAGMSAGLVLYDNWENLRKIKEGDLDEEENARLTSGLAVVFGEDIDLPTADLMGIEEYGWKVAGKKAFPTVYRKEPGLTSRLPLPWELALLAGSLRAVAAFAKGKEPSATLTVPTSAGERTFALSWAE